MQGNSFASNAASGALSGMFASSLLQVDFDVSFRTRALKRSFLFQPLDVLRTRMQQVSPLECERTHLHQLSPYILVVTH
jgi:hypothetical protein